MQFEKSILLLKNYYQKIFFLHPSIRYNYMYDLMDLLNESYAFRLYLG